MRFRDYGFEAQKQNNRGRRAILAVCSLQPGGKVVVRVLDIVELIGLFGLFCKREVRSQVDGEFWVWGLEAVVVGVKWWPADFPSGC